MRIFAVLLFFILSFVLFTSCTVLVLSYPRFVKAQKVLGAKTKKAPVLVRKISAFPSLIPTPTKIATPTPTFKPKPTPTPTSRLLPTNTPAIVSSPTLTPTPQASTKVIESSLGGSSFLDQINTYRASNGLSEVSSNSETCSFASLRASEIASDFSHSGFNNRISAKSLPYPSYHEVTENIAMNSDSSQIVNMWIKSPGHAENMRKDTPFVCVVQNGNYFVYEGWRP